jgi:hypothetical protein
MPGGKKMQVKRLFAALALLAVALVSFGNGALASEPMFTVSGVSVDVTAGTTVEARDRAIGEAQRLAFEQLYDRIAVGSADAPNLSAAELQRLVQGFEVADERSSAVRYLATYTVSFDPDAVRGLLRERGRRFADYASPPLVLLPAYGSASAWAVFEGAGPVRQGWERISYNDPLLPVILPFGDLQDLRAVSRDEALRRDPAAMSRLAARYNAGGVLAVYVQPMAGSAQAPTRLDVMAVRFDTGGGETPVRLTVDAAAGEQPGAIFATAARQVQARLRDAWKTQVSVDPSAAQNHIDAVLPVSGLSDWVEARRRLAQVSLLSGTQLQSLSPREVRLGLDFRGDEAQLRSALARRGLSLEAPATAVGEIPEGAAPIPHTLRLTGR